MPDASSERPLVEQFHFSPDGEIPNSPLPLLVYRQVVRTGDRAAAFEALFARHGWMDAWRNGIYPYHHFHSTAHEVLGIAEGEATVRFGGEEGEAVTVRAGDVVVIPAGVAHQRERASDDLVVVGAYPEGQNPNLEKPYGGRPMAEAQDAKEQAEDRAAQVSMPSADPVHGPGGPLTLAWRVQP